MKFNKKAPSVNQVITESIKNNPNRTTNAAGGVAFNLDPSTKLLTMTGGQFFNEPVYYSNGQEKDGLNSLAQEVIETAKAVTLSGTPHDILAIAHYLRKEKNIRTTPAVMLAIAAGQQNNRDRIEKYGPLVLRRPDDVLQAFAAYFALYGSFVMKNGRIEREAKLPHSFRRALAEAISKFDEYQLLKYENNEWPRWRDVVSMVERRKNYPMNSSLLHYFFTGEVVNAEETPILAARKELAKMKEWNSNVPALAKKAHVQWDQLLSQFGNKAEVWEALIDGGKSTLPVMAAIRNLRNIEQAGVSKKHWEKVNALVLGHNDPKMMPFRYISARKNTTGFEALSVADAMLDKAAMNMPKMQGVTALCLDYSGSMETRISDKSEMTKREAGTALMAVVAKSNPANTLVFEFGTHLAQSKFSASDSTWNIFSEIERDGSRVGHSTNAFLIFEYLLDKKIRVDRVILMSDMQVYNMGGYGSSLAGKFAEYKAKVNPNCKLVSIDIGGYGKAAVPSDGSVYLSTGYTEGIVNEVIEWEEGTKNSTNGDVSTAPSIEYVRKWDQENSV